MSDNKDMHNQHWKEKWWSVVKAVAYELRPFTLPSKDDLKWGVAFTVTNAKQLSDEAQRVAPEVWETVKGLKPFTGLSIIAWLCGWVGFVWLEFGISKRSLILLARKRTQEGAVYFILSAMMMVFFNLGENDDGEWSAYSVFNAGCRAILGTINVEQFEREMMHQSPDVLDHDTDMEIDMGDDEQQFHEEEEEEEENVEDENMERDDGEGSDGDNQEENEQGYVWVEPPAAALGGGDVDAGDEGKGTDEDGNGNEENRRDGVAVGAGVRVGGGRQRRVSGKRARRDFESRRERQEQRRLAQEAFGQQDEWDEF